MNKKGYTVVELLVLIGVFTIGYFIAANMLSYNFDVDYEDDLYDLKIASIEEQAIVYASVHQELFAESDDVYMTVLDLALENVIVSNKEGVVVDPRDSDATLNDLRVKITNKDDEITAEVLV